LFISIAWKQKQKMLRFQSRQGGEYWRQLRETITTKKMYSS
jgi:hypothetical protein